jgi:hypothetical protein
MSVSHARATGYERDSADLAGFGYLQEFKRTPGVFSSFSVAFSYVPPSTGFMGLSVIYGFDTAGRRRPFAPVVSPPEKAPAAGTR